MTDPIRGVVAIMLSPSGNITSSADFEVGGAAGFTELQRQEIRAKNKLKRQVLEAFSGQVFSEALSDYTLDKIMDDLLAKGWRLAYKYIGYTAEEQT